MSSYPTPIQVSAHQTAFCWVAGSGVVLKSSITGLAPLTSFLAQPRSPGVRTSPACTTLGKKPRLLPLSVATPTDRRNREVLRRGGECRKILSCSTMSKLDEI